MRIEIETLMKAINEYSEAKAEWDHGKEEFEKDHWCTWEEYLEKFHRTGRLSVDTDFEESKESLEKVLNEYIDERIKAAQGEDHGRED